jgi:catechol-2,3-dioxygenase
MSASQENAKSLNADLTPPRMSEIVLRTSEYDAVTAWYQVVLGVAPFYEHRPDTPLTLDPAETPVVTRMCFMRLFESHPYTEVMTVFEVPNLGRPSEGEPGLHHMQFRNASVEDLLVRYERLRSVGIVPMRTSNHGPGTSFYYRDPDRNIIELSANNFEGAQEYLAFFSSDAYKRNPQGVDVDADALLAAFRKGVPVAELVALR